MGNKVVAHCVTKGHKASLTRASGPGFGPGNPKGLSFCSSTIGPTTATLLRFIFGFPDCFELRKSVGLEATPEMTQSTSSLRLNEDMYGRLILNLCTPA